MLKKECYNSEKIHERDDYLLRMAVKYNLPVLVYKLLEKGANPRARDEEAIKTAVNKKFMLVLQLLLKKNVGFKKTLVKKVILECPICFNEYNRVRQAIAYGCGHLLCRMCLEKVNDNCHLCKSKVEIIIPLFL
jgi:hypothetical protein